MWEYGIQAGNEGGQLGRQIFRLLEQPDALSVFADFLGLAAGQIVQSRTAVGVDIPIGFVFAVEILKR